MFFKNNGQRQQFFIPAGLLALSCSIIMRRILGDAIPHANFFEGLFLGLAFALSVAGLIYTAVARNYE